MIENNKNIRVGMLVEETEHYIRILDRHEGITNLVLKNISPESNQLIWDLKREHKEFFKREVPISDELTASEIAALNYVGSTLEEDTDDLQWTNIKNDYLSSYCFHHLNTTKTINNSLIQAYMSIKTPSNDIIRFHYHKTPNESIIINTDGTLIDPNIIDELDIILLNSHHNL